MRLIDADALERAIMDTGIYPATVRRAIRKAPEAVVRCEDCLYSRRIYGHLDCIYGICYRNTANDAAMFCSYGQRREDK